VSIILPTAPANFYTPSLNTLKDILLATNGSTKGQITLLTATPDNANTAWAEVGAGNPNIDSTRGTLVAGQAEIELIIGPSPAYLETGDEFGYKLEMAKISNVVIDIQGFDSSALIVGFAMIVGRDTFAQGTNDDVRYLAKLEDALITEVNSGNTIESHAVGVLSIPVDDDDIIEIPEWELIINYAQPIT